MTYYALQISAKHNAIKNINRLQILHVWSHFVSKTSKSGCQTYIPSLEHRNGCEILTWKDKRDLDTQNSPRGPPENRPVWNALLMPVKIPIAQNEMPSTPKSDISRLNAVWYPSSWRRLSEISTSRGTSVVTLWDSRSGLLAGVVMVGSPRHKQRFRDEGAPKPIPLMHLGIYILRRQGGLYCSNGEKISIAPSADEEASFDNRSSPCCSLREVSRVLRQ